MMRLIAILVLLLGLAATSAWIADAPGQVMIDWKQYRIETNMLGLLLVTAGGMLALWLSIKIVGSLIFFRKRWRSRQTLQRQQRGLEMLTRALAALSLSDLKTAQHMARQAEILLGRAPVTLMLSAQLARAQHNELAAARYLEAMLEHSETKLLAYQGLIEQARRKGDIDSAIIHANEAFRAFPRDHFVVTTLIDLYALKGNWQEALLYVDRAVKNKAIARDRGKYLRAAIYTASGQAALAEGNASAALTTFKQSLSQHGGLVAATTGLAKALVALNQPSMAAQVIEKAWKITPHPELGGIYLSLIPAGSEAAWIKRAQKMAAKSSHPESYLLLAQIYAKLEQWAPARQYAQQSLQILENARALHLLAEIEEKQFSDHTQAAIWLTRARQVAPADPAWSCTECGTATTQWALHCPRCGSFESIQWQARSLRSAKALKAA